MIFSLHKQSNIIICHSIQQYNNRRNTCQLQSQTVTKYVTAPPTNLNPKCYIHSPNKTDFLSTESYCNQHPQFRCDKFYDPNQLNKSRTTAFGYGSKYDFTKDGAKSPPPNTYNLKSDFDKDQKKGFGFGFSRNQMEVTGPFMQTKRDKNPGPGAYDSKDAMNNTITYSLGARNYKQDHQKIKIPGPGSYPITFSINEKGLYFLSKYKNSCIRNFSSNTERGKISPNKVPGPGAYPTDKTDFSQDGKYFWSKMHSSYSRRFGTSQRSNIARKSITPGPGNYKLPSQFGHYLSKLALKKPQTEQTTRKVAASEQKQNQKA